jgi:hypothetical protein
MEKCFSSRFSWEDFPARAGNGSELRTLMALSWGDHHGEGPSTAVTSEVKLGRQPSAAAAEPFVAWMLDPFFHQKSVQRRASAGEMLSW